MVLATAKIGDFDRFWNTFSTKGAEKRKQHGCKGAHVFRDPNESEPERLERSSRLVVLAGQLVKH